MCICAFVCVHNVARSLLELGSVCSGVEWYALSLAFALYRFRDSRSILQYCIISLTSDAALAIETGAVTSALVSYPDPSARRGHLVWKGGAH